MDEQIEQAIKNKVLKSIKPINFGDELSIPDLWDDDSLGSIIKASSPKGPELQLILKPPQKASPIKRTEPVICRVCEKPFATKRYLKKHFSKHTGKFSCPYCKKSFARKETQLKHIPNCPSVEGNERHRRAKAPVSQRSASRFPCDQCSKSFTRKENYLEHSLSHSGLLVQCEACENTYSCYKSFRRHRKLHFSDDDKSVMHCLLCSSTFTSKEALKKHMKLNRHSNNISCDICNKLLRNEEVLQKHLDQAEVKGCPVCDANFCFISDWKDHLKNDHYDYWFICKICFGQTTFMTRSKQHILMHVEKNHGITLETDECYTKDWFTKFKE